METFSGYQQENEGRVQSIEMKSGNKHQDGCDYQTVQRRSGCQTPGLGREHTSVPA